MFSWIGSSLSGSVPSTTCTLRTDGVGGGGRGSQPDGGFKHGRFAAEPFFNPAAFSIASHHGFLQLVSLEAAISGASHKSEVFFIPTSSRHGDRSITGSLLSYSNCIIGLIRKRL
jgi:hypothetical protein